MKLPGFTAEASVYRTTGRYYMSGAPVQNDRSIYPTLHHPTLQFCPPKCISACEQGCRADGLSTAVCARLCNLDCSMYGGGMTVSCDPCVNGLRTCILCGGAVVIETCVTCEVCPDGSCKNVCAGGTCPCGAFCCDDGDGCCQNGWYCVNCFGWKFCSPVEVPFCDNQSRVVQLPRVPMEPVRGGAQIVSPRGLP